MSKWTKAEFEVSAYMRGTETVAGYSNGTFGIDKRGGRMWMVTHLPSGLAVEYLRGDTLARCKANVDKAAYLKWDAKEVHALAALNEMSTLDFADTLRLIGKTP